MDPKLIDAFSAIVGREHSATGEEALPFAHDYTEARFLAEDKMGQLLLQPILIDGAEGSDAYGEDHPRFSYKWVVSQEEIPAPMPPPIQRRNAQTFRPFNQYIGKVTVTVSWTRLQQSYEFTLETLIAPDRFWTVQQEVEDPRVFVEPE